MQKIKLYFNKIKFDKIMEDKKFSYSIIVLFSILLMWPCLFGKFHIGDDGYFHLANIFVYAQDLPFSIFAKILPVVGNDLGFGTGIFYPALPHIMGAIILKFVGVFGHDVIVAETLLHFLIFLLSGITMFWLGKAVFKDNKKGLIVSLFYITYNYFFVDVIVRDALNESFMFIFIPLVFLGLYNLFIEKDIKKFYIWFIIGYVGLMYSHLVMSVYFTIFLLFFLLFFVKEIFNKKTFFHLCLASVIILIFTSTFTVLMVEHKLFGDYVAFAERTMTYDTIWYMPFHGFFVPHIYSTEFNGGLLYSNLHYIVVIFFVLTIIKLITKKVDAERRKFIWATLVFAILGILLNTFVVVWLHVPSVLLSIQFIWRLSLFVGFGFALVAAESLDWFLGIFKKKFIPLALIIIIVFLGVSIFENNSKLRLNTEFNIKESLWGGTVREYYPTITFKKYRDYFDNRDSEEIIILKGNAEALVLENDVPYMKFKISNVKNNATIELPRLYYLGYKITDSKGNVIKYKQDKYRFISLNVSKDDVYTVEYTGTLAYKISCILKILLIIGIIIYIIYYKRKNKKLI